MLLFRCCERNQKLVGRNRLGNLCVTMLHTTIGNRGYRSRFGTPGCRMRSLGIALLILPAIAGAVDQTANVDITTAIFPPQVRYVTAAPDGGAHALVQHRDGVISFDRYSADGSRLTRIFEPETDASGGGFYETARLLAIDEGVVALDRRCALTQVDSDVLWRSRAQSGVNSCFLPAIAPAGALWLSSVSADGGYRIDRFDSAGRLATTARGLGVFQGVSNPLAIGDGGAYVGGTTSSLGGAAVLVRLASDGSVRFRWQATGGQAQDLRWLQERRDGGVLALGAAGDDQVVVLSISPDAQLLSLRSLGLLRASQIVGFVGDAESRYAVIANRALGGQLSLQMSGAESPLGLPSGFECVPGARGCALSALENGEVEFLIRQVEGSQPARLLRVSRVGTVLGDRSIPFARPSFADRGSNGWWIIADGNLVRLDIEGMAGAIPIEPANVSLRFLGEYQRNGVRYLALADAGAVTIARLDVDGGVIWQRSFDGGGSQGLPWSDAAMQLSDGFACFRDERPSASAIPVRCVRHGDGATLLEVFPNEQIGPQFALFANGILAMLDRTLESTAQVRRWRIADGREQSPVALPPLRIAEGLRLRSDRNLGTSMVAVGRSIQGSVVAAWFDHDDTAARSFPLTLMPVEFGVDGQYLVLIEDRVTGAARRLFLRAIDTAMDRELHHSEIDPAYDGTGRVLKLVIGNGNRFLSLSRAPIAPAVAAPSARVLSMTPDWRSMLWQNVELAPVLTYLEQPDRLVLARAENGAIGFYLRDADGEPAGSRTMPCDASTDCWSNLHIDRSIGGDISIAFNRYQTNDGRQLRSLRTNVGARSEIRMDQSGIAGPWFHPGTPGQGFLLNYIPEANLIFAPWFAYSGARYGDQAQLAWYYLQGTVAADSSRAELDIVRNTNGQFATPPTTQPEIVGRAELYFHDCDNATLSYRFEAGVESGRIGSMPWQRLGARLFPCLRFDGSTQSPGSEAPDVRGFSRRQSGAWFEPVTSGQGLMFEVQPPRDDDPGFVFGAWFTYDVARNDAQAQDWFTLQAPIGEVTGGRIELPILRVIGGELDRIATRNVFRVGSATLTFNGCDRAVFQFQFETSELAAEHSGRSGIQQLQRAGGCGP